MSAMITASTTRAPARLRVATSRASRTSARALRPALAPRVHLFVPSRVPTCRAAPEDDAPEPELIDRDNLDERYYRGFLESSLGPDDSVQADGRDTLTASVKLGAQATAVLGALFLAFMWSNGLL